MYVFFLRKHAFERCCFLNIAKEVPEASLLAVETAIACSSLLTNENGAAALPSQSLRARPRRRSARLVADPPPSADLGWGGKVAFTNYFCCVEEENRNRYEVAILVHHWNRHESAVPLNVSEERDFMN